MHNKKKTETETEPLLSQDDVTINVRDFCQDSDVKDKAKCLREGFSTVFNACKTRVKKNSYLKKLLKRFEDPTKFFKTEFEKLDIQLPPKKYELSHNGLLDPKKYSARQRTLWWLDVCMDPHNYKKLRKRIGHFTNHLPPNSPIRLEIGNILTSMDELYKIKDRYPNYFKTEFLTLDNMKTNGPSVEILQEKEYRFIPTRVGTQALALGTMGVCGVGFFEIAFAYLATKHLGWTTKDLLFRLFFVLILLITIFFSACMMCVGSYAADRRITSIGGGHRKSVDYKNEKPRSVKIQKKILTNIMNGFVKIFEYIEKTQKSPIKFETIK